MNERNKAIVRRYFTEVLRNGKYDTVKEIFSPSFIFHGPSLTKPINGMPEGIYDFIASVRKAFPDLYVSIENEIAEDHQVVVVWRMTGTHMHTFRNVPPTGKHISITGTDIFYIDHGKIEGMWAFFDMRSMLEQMVSGSKKNRRSKARSSRQNLKPRTKNKKP
jgi:steroid delta-isomerase-like uncharacterized protein